MEEQDYGSGIKRYSMSGDEALKFLDNYGKGIEARDSVNEGAKLFMAGNYIAAEAKFKEAIATNPKNAVAHANIGNIYFKRKQYQNAIPWLEKALTLDPAIKGVIECLNECRQHKKQWWQFWK
jgi:tetratricopeptide (TPR) repeat protein